MAGSEQRRLVWGESGTVPVDSIDYLDRTLAELAEGSEAAEAADPESEGLAGPESDGLAGPESEGLAGSAGRPDRMVAECGTAGVAPGRAARAAPTSSRQVA